MAGPLTKFDLFSSLPTELRTAIWNHAIETPRLIELRSITERALSPSQNTTFRVRNTLPTLLQTCHESRSQALQHYRLKSLSDDPQSCPRIYYIDPTVDIIYLSHYMLKDMFDLDLGIFRFQRWRGDVGYEAYMRKMHMWGDVRCVALCAETGAMFYLSQVRENFPGLRELLLVVRENVVVVQEARDRIDKVMRAKMRVSGEGHGIVTRVLTMKELVQVTAGSTVREIGGIGGIGCSNCGYKV